MPSSASPLFAFKRPASSSVPILLLLPCGLLLYTALQQTFLLSTKQVPQQNHDEMIITTMLHSVIQTSSVTKSQQHILDSDYLDDDQVDLPQIVWLASFPNSGTSYTMTMVEQASNRSTATHYGLEVTDYKYPSIPLHAHHPEGPYWQGENNGKAKSLPETYILTKTHCGGRCVRCGATAYVVNASTYLDACARTTARLGKNARTMETNRMDPTRGRVAKVVHLIRNPFTNIVARFHLESRNIMRREERTGQWLPKNATGMRNFCFILDEFYAPDELKVFDAAMMQLMADVPCRAEFYKWTQWHNRLGQVLLALGTPSTPNVPTLTLHYEDYHAKLNATAGRVLDFLELPPRVLPYRAFRELPDYADHFTEAQRKAAWRLIEALATPWTWERIQRYRLEENF